MGVFKRHFIEYGDFDLGIAMIKAMLSLNMTEDLRGICEEIELLKHHKHINLWRNSYMKDYREMMQLLSDWGKQHGYIF